MFLGRDRWFLHEEEEDEEGVRSYGGLRSQERAGERATSKR